VDSVPADPFGANADAAASAGGTGSISAKLRHISSALGSILTAVDGLEASVDGLETLFAGGLPAALGSGGGLKVEQVAALPAGTNNIGDVDVASLPALPAGDNNIGDVDVASLPALASGTNNIGDVDVLTVPADPFGANADAAVAAGAAGSIQAKLRRATQGLEDLKTLIVLAAGTNAIGKLSPNSGVDIGDVDVTATPKGSTSSNVAQTSQGTTAAEVLASNANRKQAVIQNTGTTVVKLGLGRTPTATAYHVALKACASADDGTGGTFVTDLWTGAINAISSASGGTLVVTELT
jgi:hypothetical protein